MISILLATYNGEKYIKKSIESVLKQTYRDFELLIGLNGTTDSTREIINKFADPRIKIFDYGNDKGKSKTLNKLLLEAKYEIIALQDDDDIWLPRKLEKQMQLMDNEFSVVGTQIFYIDENENITGQPRLSLLHDDIKTKSLTGDNQIANTSAIFYKNCAIQVGGWDEKIIGIEDFDFWLRLIRLNHKFININKELVLHRIHSSSNFNTKKWDVNKIL